jgi:hypothetical protein
MDTFITSRPLLAYMLDRFIPLCTTDDGVCVALRSAVTRFCFRLPYPRGTFREEEWIRVLLQHELRSIGERYLTALQPLIMTTFYVRADQGANPQARIDEGEWALRSRYATQQWSKTA